MLVVTEPLWLAQTNCYLVAREQNSAAIAIDAPPDPAAIAALARRYGLAIGALVLTHGHVDHAGGAGAVHRAAGAAVYVHPDDDFLTLDPASQLRMLFGQVPRATMSRRWR